MMSKKTRIVRLVLDILKVVAGFITGNQIDSIL